MIDYNIKFLKYKSKEGGFEVINKDRVTKIEETSNSNGNFVRVYVDTGYQHPEVLTFEGKLDDLNRHFEPYFFNIESNILVNH